ncbi:MAG: anaerobic ribonucleoside-triphosphate reductase activating protein [Caldimicrobium sp.]|nr:anaerobic ribonucleoside-triphosphate reductase activating protein [Caldimicrobium sp.]MCX7874363.1 anaerobic ribonucleoside-triphosphate reductase activating protein [Caldimicrobium sp.]MDW8093489.1 anaerobic ribonucleoside-triphosphate reductase activating protein [Caldimicrobium sp.]
MIKGFRGTSLVDYPGKIASVIYTYGCNFRCPYCYNIELLLPEFYKDLEDLSEEKIIQHLKERLSFIQGVVITGGEPTIWGKRLLSLIDRLKCELALPIKLDTNGSNPEVIKILLEENLIDYIALDLKTSPQRYSELGGDFTQVEKTLDYLKDHVDKVEIRLTLYPGLIGEEELESLLPYLKPFCRIALQKYLPEKNLSGIPLTPYPKEVKERFFLYLQNHIPESHLIKRF